MDRLLHHRPRTLKFEKYFNWVDPKNHIGDENDKREEEDLWGFNNVEN
jgi:hypothetical protein